MPDKIKALVKSLREIHAFATRISLEERAKFKPDFHAEWMEIELCAILRDMEYKILVYQPNNNVGEAYERAITLSKELKEHEILMVLRHPHTDIFLKKYL